MAVSWPQGCKFVVGDLFIYRKSCPCYLLALVVSENGRRSGTVHISRTPPHKHLYYQSALRKFYCVQFLKFTLAYQSNVYCAPIFSSSFATSCSKTYPENAFLKSHFWGLIKAFRSVVRKLANRRISLNNGLYGS